MKKRTELLLLAAVLFFSGAGLVVHAYLPDGKEASAETGEGQVQMAEAASGNAEYGEIFADGADFAGENGTVSGEISGQETQKVSAEVTGQETQMASAEESGWETQTASAEMSGVETQTVSAEMAGPEQGSQSVYADVSGFEGNLETVLDGQDTGVVEEGNLSGESDGEELMVTPFYSDGAAVTYHEAEGAVYFVAEDVSASGKYGFLAENVGSGENGMLDIRFTVDGFKDYVYDKNGEKVEGQYPAFGFRPKDGLSMVFAGPDQNIRIEFLEHGTENPAKGTYSFRWVDIDAGQRFGLSLEDGILADRYTTISSTLSFQEGFSRMNREYCMVNAAQDSGYVTGEGDWLDGCVYWEVQDCSRMNLLIGTAGSPKRGRYGAKTCRSRYEQYCTGIFSSPVSSVLGSLEWDEFIL